MTRQQAINAMCKDCIYDPKAGNGTWRQQVEACNIPQCPLFKFRPVSRTKTHTLQDTQALTYTTL